MAQEATLVSGVSGRYASALFALAQEQKSTDAVAGALESFRQLLESSPDLQRLVRSPVFSGEEQAKALKPLLEKAGISGVPANFLLLLAKKRRLFAVADMIRDYGRLNDQAKGVARAEIIVAEPLGEAHMAALQDALRQITRGRSVDVTTKVDPSIIGGLVVKLGSRMFDGSLKTKLSAIRTRMKEVG